MILDENANAFFSHVLFSVIYWIRSRGQAMPRK